MKFKNYLYRPKNRLALEITDEAVITQDEVTGEYTVIQTYIEPLTGNEVTVTVVSGFKREPEVGDFISDDLSGNFALWSRDEFNDRHVIE